MIPTKTITKCTTCSPKSILGKEYKPNLITSLNESRIMWVMRTPYTIESGIFDHLYITTHSRIRHSISPSGLILMHVGTQEIIVFPIQEKALVCCPVKPTKSKSSLIFIHHFSVCHYCCHSLVLLGRFRRPQLRFTYSWKYLSNNLYFIPFHQHLRLYF